MINYIGYLILGFFTLILFYAIWQSYQFKRFTTGAVLCRFRTHTNKIYFKVLPTDGKQIIPPYGKWSKKKDKQEAFKTKNGNYILPDSVPTVRYPLGGWPDFLKIDVPYVSYVEGNPNPLKENLGIPDFDTNMLAAMQNVAFIRTIFRKMLTDAEETYKGKQNKNDKYIIYGILASSVLNVILGFVLISKIGPISDGIRIMLSALGAN